MMDESFVVNDSSIEPHFISHTPKWNGVFVIERFLEIRITVKIQTLVQIERTKLLVSASVFSRMGLRNLFGLPILDMPLTKLELLWYDF